MRGSLRVFLLAISLITVSALPLAHNIFTPIREADGLEITTTVRLTSDTTYTEHVYIKSGGHLIIDPGVTVRMGTSIDIIVEDGQLSVLGGVNNKARIWGNGVVWGGIEANRDSTVIMYHCEIKWAEAGLRIQGSGHSGTPGSIQVNDTSFLVCDKGIVLNGNGMTGPFKCRIWDTYITNTVRGVEVVNEYDGFVLEDIQISDADEIGVMLNGVDGNIVRNLTVSDARFGMTFGMLNGPITIDNNTLRDCKIGLNGAFTTGGVKISNNSVFATEKGIWMGLTSGNLIENNIITVISDVTRAPIEMESGTPPTVIRNNILTGCGPMMIINSSSSGVDIHDNLLTNLTDPMYVDSNGDGYCDNDVRADGTANAWAKNCRTSIIPKIPSPGSHTYVNPAQAADNAAPGSSWIMISNPSGYGPENLEDRHIYHSKLPRFESSLYLEGQEKEFLVFYPGACTQNTEFNAVSNAGISNFTVKEGESSILIIDSDNITVSKMDSFGYQNFLVGIDIDTSQDIHISDVILSASWMFGLNISGSYRIDIIDSKIISPDGKGVYLDNSFNINADDVNVSTSDEPALYSVGSMFSWNGSTLASKQESIVMYNSDNCMLSFVEPRTYNPSDRLMVVTNCVGTQIIDCEFQMGFRTYDFYGLELYGNIQDTLIENTLFIAESGHAFDTYGVTARGNFSGGTVRDCRFIQMTYGIGIVDFSGTTTSSDVEIYGTTFSESTYGSMMLTYGNISIIDSNYLSMEACHQSLGNVVFLQNGYFNGFDYGVGGVANIEAINCTFINGNIGINVDSGMGDEYLIIDGLIMNGVKEGIHVRGIPLSMNDASFNNIGICVNGTDTENSLITNTDFQNNLPIVLNLSYDELNRVELRNCTGIHSLTEARAPGCYANWTWPLTVFVDDEGGDPLTCALTVDSSSLGSIYADMIDGYMHFPGLMGYSIDNAGITDTKDYDVSVQGMEDSDSESVEMIQERILNFLLNHVPTLSGSAPSDISMNEDEVMIIDVSDWFIDRDDLSFSLMDQSPAEVSFSLAGSELTVEPQADWNGNGSFEIKAVDTFMEEVSHTVILHVLPMNDPPFLVKEIPVINITEDSSAWINLSDYVDDIDSISLDFGVEAVYNISTSWNGLRNLTIEPAENWFGLETLTIEVTDESKTLMFNITLNVTPVNDPPSWLGDAVIPITVNAGEDYQTDIIDHVLDVDNQFEELMITFDPQNGSISGSTVTISYPEETKNMTEIITVTISDGELSTSFQFDVTVVKKPDIPVEPELEIDDSNVNVDEGTGDWTVEIDGDEDQEIWIVIDGVGSYEMEETFPGHYEVVIPGSNFEEGETYDYYFSDEEGGPDRTGGSHSGSKDQPVITPVDDDDDDNDDDDGSALGGLWWIWILVIGVLIAFILAFVLFRKNKDWDIEE